MRSLGTRGRMTDGEIYLLITYHTLRKFPLQSFSNGVYSMATTGVDAEDAGMLMSVTSKIQALL